MEANFDTVNFEFFNILTKQQKETIVKDIEVKNFPDKHIFYNTGEDNTDAFFIFSGATKAYSMSSDGNTSYNWARKAGDMFGFYSAITGKEQTATMVAIGDVTVGVLKREDFISYIMNNSKLSRYMLELVTNILRLETIRISFLSIMDTKTRVALALVYRDNRKDSIMLDNPSREEFASWLGMSRETLSRHISDLNKKGLISFDGKNIKPHINKLEDAGLIQL